MKPGVKSTLKELRAGVLRCLGEEKAALAGVVRVMQHSAAEMHAAQSRIRCLEDMAACFAEPGKVRVKTKSASKKKAETKRRKKTKPAARRPEGNEKKFEKWI